MRNVKSFNTRLNVTDALSCLCSERKNGPHAVWNALTTNPVRMAILEATAYRPSFSTPIRSTINVRSIVGENAPTTQTMPMGTAYGNISRSRSLLLGNANHLRMKNNPSTPKTMLVLKPTSKTPSSPALNTRTATASDVVCSTAKPIAMTRYWVRAKVHFSSPCVKLMSRMNGSCSSTTLNNRTPFGVAIRKPVIHSAPIQSSGSSTIRPAN